jgi:hypothetical protein
MAVRAKAASPSAPSKPPLASDQALVVPSFFSMSVRLAGRIAGKARKSPPNLGPTAMPAMAAIAVIPAPKRKRIPSSLGSTERSFDQSKPTVSRSSRRNWWPSIA